MGKLRLIAGSGRSGTTWVLDSIAEANRLRPIFEPLHPDTSRIGREFGYAYLTRKDESSDLKRFFGSIASNNMRSVWTSYRVKPIRLRPVPGHLQTVVEVKRLLRIWGILARRRWAYRERERRDAVLVKCVRANLMLDWIRSNFEAQIVLLMRHPCAVVESQLRFAEHWDPYVLVDKFKKDKALMGGLLRDRAKILHQEFSRPQALAAVWCVENLVPALQAAANNYQVVFYEELMERPDVEWRRIAEGLGLLGVPSAGLLDQPSQQAAVRLQKRAITDGNYQESYSSWRTRLSSEDIRQIATVLDAFGVKFYTVFADRPDVQAFTQQFFSR